KSLMSGYVGIVRNKEGLLYAKGIIDSYLKEVYNMRNVTIKDLELQNMLILAMLVVESAIEREESRGAHFRTDFDKTNDSKWRKNIIRLRKI
ncbi:MAG TPA: L-aspartate oxidase, partial [Clostridia bacterium]